APLHATSRGSPTLIDTILAIPMPSLEYTRRRTSMPSLGFVICWLHIGRVMNRSSILIVLLVAVSSQIALAQSQARLTGTVTDNSGAVLVAANVSVRNVDTGVVTAATTNASGIYTVPFLNP